ncbi:GIY-YIG nuclease family protein [Caldithrix abyssi]
MNEQRYITYQLMLEIKEPITLTIGVLGRFTLPAGRYLYTGSARKNIDQRICRHFKKVKPRRWHIDYLTTHPAVTIIAVQKFSAEECQVNQQSPGQILITGFGASDCLQNCGAHLKFLPPLDEQSVRV